MSDNEKTANKPPRKVDGTPPDVEHSRDSEANKHATPLAIITALGIVYGDLGTSPLYVFPALKKAIGASFDETAALGSLSLIFWTLIIIVSIKYCLVVMRADNHGEGGTLALMSTTRISWRGRKRIYLMFGLLGAALIYGDGIITPSISVLSAIEGLNVATDAFAPYTAAIAAAILVLLFSVQRFGTNAVGKTFGPIMLIWFITIAVLGIFPIVRHPQVLLAVNPINALTFLIRHSIGSLAILGAIFLAVTGAEAMYADMGHVGRNSIRTAWFVLVLPALLVNYAGQTASAIGSSTGDGHPFFGLVPGWALYPVVGFATIATVIASQAIISGAFSLTRQAVQLGWLPGLNIRQTSDAEYGQIYVPIVNWTMMVATVTLTLAFGSSDKLAGAYGTAVSTTMLLTTALLYRVMTKNWKWSRGTAAAVFIPFMFVDLVFFCANLTKITEGGWIPLTIAVLIYVVMTTWRTGADAMRRGRIRDTVTIDHFKRELREGRILRLPGCAIFLTRMHHVVPGLIADHIRQMGSLYEKIVALTVRFTDRPRVGLRSRIQVEEIGEGVWHLTIRFGFVEAPNVPKALHTLKSDCPFDLDEAIYFSEQDKIVSKKGKPRLASWRRFLFAFLYRNSIHPADRFGLPPQKFVQIGRRIDI